MLAQASAKIKVLVAVSAAAYWASAAVGGLAGAVALGLPSGGDGGDKVVADAYHVAPQSVPSLRLPAQPTPYQ